MKVKDRKYFEGNLLLVINSLALFLTIFENKLSLPLWLTSIGRMHPMILHFPIVIILLALILEFLSITNRIGIGHNREGLIYYLFFTGAISAAITVIMGLFLSNEGGYNEKSLIWHKWLGLSVSIITFLIYTLREYHWYTKQVAKFAIFFTAGCIVLTGHFGAILTHGENFILAPLTAIEPTAKKFEEALVYDDLIQPILQSKCNSCHNNDKKKGRLSLSDSSAIVKGGKTGRLFVAGAPEMSLMLERLHLPVNNRKHMPPSGNPQLTEQEIQLLYWWVNSGAPFDKKLIELPLQDTLRKMASEIFESDDQEEEMYSFASARQEDIQYLNNKNRTISPFSKTSPALDVRIFNSAAYNISLIEELNVVKDQVVSLSLDRLPIKDIDVQAILMFKNLRRLNLNSTQITSAAIAQLEKLKHLQFLSLSGTKLNFQDLYSSIKNASNNKTIYLWNTGIEMNEVKILRQKFPSIVWIAGYVDDGSNPLQLNNVTIENPIQVFTDSVQIKLNHVIKGAEIRYTIDGSEPDSVRSPVFNELKWYHNNTVIKARAFKKGWSSSGIAEFSFFKAKIIPDSVLMSGPLHYRFPGMGKETFFDRRLGGVSPFGDKWAGIVEQPVTLTLLFTEAKDISSVMFQFLMMPSMNAGYPGQIEIYGGDSENDCQIISRIRSKKPNNKVVKIDQIETNFKSRRVKVLKITLIPAKLNDGKLSSNTLSFIDEIFLN